MHLSFTRKKIGRIFIFWHTFFKVGHLFILYLTITFLLVKSQFKNIFVSTVLSFWESCRHYVMVSASQQTSPKTPCSFQNGRLLETIVCHFFCRVSPLHFNIVIDLMQELHCRSVHKCVFIPNIPKKSFEEELKLKWKKKRKKRK